MLTAPSFYPTHLLPQNSLYLDSYSTSSINPPQTYEYLTSVSLEILAFELQ